MVHTVRAFTRFSLKSLVHARFFGYQGDVPNVHNQRMAVMADTYLRKNLLDEHQTRKDNKVSYTRIKDTYAAAEALLSTNYIPQHLFEEGSSYTTRVKRAFTFPVMQKCVNQMLSVLFATSPLRGGKAIKELGYFLKDATGTEIALSYYMRTAAAAAIMYGRGCSFVDFTMQESSADIPITRAALDAGIIYPTVKLIDANSLRNWRYIPRKGFEAVTWDDTAIIDGEQKKIIMYCDYDSIMECDDQGNMLNEYAHTLGFTPVFSLPYTPDAGIIGSIGNLMASGQIALTNMCSVFDEISERQAFSQLMMPDDGSLEEYAQRRANEVDRMVKSGEMLVGDTPKGDLILAKLSQARALTYPSNTGHPPSFITPNATEMKNVWRAIKEILVLLPSLTSVADQRGNVSLEAGYTVLSDFIKSIAAHEESILKTVCAYIGLDSADTSVEYPIPMGIANADASQVPAWVEAASSVAAATWLTPEAKTAVITDIVTAALPTLPVEARAAIIDGIIIQTTTENSGDDSSTTQPQNDKEAPNA